MEWVEVTRKVRAPVNERGERIVSEQDFERWAGEKCGHSYSSPWWRAMFAPRCGKPVRFLVTDDGYPVCEKHLGYEIAIFQQGRGSAPRVATEVKYIGNFKQEYEG
jgi:hypothetical protein